MMKVFILLLVLAALTGGLQAAVYYVSSSAGNDNSCGLSPAQAWKTIARVNETRFHPGDTVLFKRGNLWRETLVPTSSGSDGHSITYGAYGSGPKPVISGSDLVSAARIHWSDGLTYITGIDKVPAALWSAKTRMTPVPSLTELRAISQWFYDSATKRVYFVANSTRQFEIQARDLNIDNHEQSHIVYDNLDLKHAREGLRLYSWKSPVSDIILQNSTISTELSAPHAMMSAGVYASVHTASLSKITIRNNRFVPFPAGLEHWGVYFVQGVSDFQISGNQFSQAGEDAITIWHSQHGVISDNSGGGNGENTVDVKDSHDIVIRGNRATADGEYNIVVHGVDSDQLTYNVIVEKNRCIRGGQAGHLTAGIVLLFTRDSKVRNNNVQNAYGAGIFLNDRGIGSRNEIFGNVLSNNGTRQKTGAITLEDVSETTIYNNTISGQGSGGFALQIEGGPHTRRVRITGNTFLTENGRMISVAASGEVELFVDQNSYSSEHQPSFRLASQELSFSAWRAVSRQDVHSTFARPQSMRQTQLSPGLPPAY